MNLKITRKSRRLVRQIEFKCMQSNFIDLYHNPQGSRLPMAQASLGLKDECRNSLVNTNVVFSKGAPLVIYYSTDFYPKFANFIWNNPYRNKYTNTEK